MANDLITGLCSLVASAEEASHERALNFIASKVRLKMASFWRYNSRIDTVSIVCRYNYHADASLREEHIHAATGSLIGYIMNRCSETDAPYLRIPDVNDHEFIDLHRNPARVQSLGLKELLSLPIWAYATPDFKETLGFLNLYCEIPESLSDDECRVIQHMFSVLDQKIELRRREVLSNHIIAAFQNIYSSPQPDSALDSIVRATLPAALSVDACSLYEWSTSKNTFKLAATTGILNVADAKTCSDYLGVGLVGETARQNRVIVIDDLANMSDIEAKVGRKKTREEIWMNMEQTAVPPVSVMLCPIHNPAAKSDSMPVAVLKFVNKKCRLSSITDWFSLRDISLVSDVSKLMAFYEDHQKLERSRIAFALQFGHEAQAPAVGIKGAAERLIRHHPTKTLNEHQQLSMYENIKSFADLIISFSDSITYGYADKSSSFKERYRVRLQNLRTVVEQAKRIVIPLCRMENLQFDDIRISGSYPDLYIDGRALAQVFYNLLTNAIKYRDRPSGQFKVLITCYAASRTFRAPTSPEGPPRSVAIRGYHIDVQDFGIGIEEPYRNEIFSEGYRVPSVSAREMRGSGIGLSVVRNIVREFGGLVSVSNLSNPTSFRIFLPSYLETPDYINARAAFERYGGR